MLYSSCATTKQQSSLTSPGKQTVRSLCKFSSLKARFYRNRLNRPGEHTGQIIAALDEKWREKWREQISIILTLFIIAKWIIEQARWSSEESECKEIARSRQVAESRPTRREPGRTVFSLIDLINQFEFLFLLNWLLYFGFLCCSRLFYSSCRLFFLFS